MLQPFPFLPDALLIRRSCASRLIESTLCFIPTKPAAHFDSAGLMGLAQFVRITDSHPTECRFRRSLLH